MGILRIPKFYGSLISSAVTKVRLRRQSLSRLLPHTDVSLKGGVTAVMKTAHLAESFGVQCELYTTIYHPLELYNFVLTEDILIDDERYETYDRF